MIEIYISKEENKIHTPITTVMKLLSTKSYIGGVIKGYHVPLFCKDFLNYLLFMDLYKVYSIDNYIKYLVKRFHEELNCNHFVYFDTFNEYLNWLQKIEFKGD